MTGESNPSTKAFMTFFKPLLDWLVNENVKQGDILGWPDYSCSFEGQEGQTKLTGPSSDAAPGPALTCSGSILNSSELMTWHEPAQWSSVTPICSRSETTPASSTVYTQPLLCGFLARHLARLSSWLLVSGQEPPNWAYVTPPTYIIFSSCFILSLSTSLA